jgi:hypothetical protein
MRIRLELVASLVVKMECWRRKYSAHRSNLNTSQNIKNNIPLVESLGSLQRSTLPNVLVISVLDEQDLETLMADKYAPLSALHVYQCMDKLRMSGIAATGYVHQLLRGLNARDDSDPVRIQLSRSSLLSTCRYAGVRWVVQIFSRDQVQHPLEMSSKLLLHVMT